MPSDDAGIRAAFFRGRKTRRVVVKLGSGILTDASLGLRETTIRRLADQVSRAWDDPGIQFVIVTSGAIAAGRKKMGLAEKPRTVALKQAAAAVGQPTLMRAYERAFDKRGRRVGQLLLTHEDFEDRQRYLNARNTLETLLSQGIVPIINENDTVATEEIRMGDNDALAALVTQMVGAGLMVLLTDADGLYTKDPNRFPDARRIPVVERIDDAMMALAGATRAGSIGTGGMASKLSAARVVSSWGTPVIITSGFAKRPVLDAIEGLDAGTLVLPQPRVRARSRKMWIANAPHVAGIITVDDGARAVLLNGGKSLLPAGVIAVSGEFGKGDAVSVCDRRGVVFARGIAGWSSAQVAKGQGYKSAEIGKLLGAGVPPEVIHRDDLTILPAARQADARKKGDKPS
ncbi:MAG TPA: glutamate 5-kinase [Candidatus Deferrimicrobiaceae bacterium]|jgi:glutamate 5-kinase